MSELKPQTCPVCKGNGIVPAGFYTQTSGEWLSTGGTEKCRACDGSGIVWNTCQPDTVLEEKLKRADFEHANDWSIINNLLALVKQAYGEGLICDSDGMPVESIDCPCKVCATTKQHLQKALKIGGIIPQDEGGTNG